MTYAYFDACSILAMLLGEPQSERARAHLGDSLHRVATPLLNAEVLCSLHRVARPRMIPQDFLSLLETWQRLWATFLHIPTDEVIEHLHEVSSARLRTVDALHLAACVMIQASGAELVLYTRDRELMGAAERWGVTVVES